MVLRGVIISVLSLNQATLGWGFPPLERQVTLIMSPWLIAPDMSPCICGSPGGSADNFSYYSQAGTLGRCRVARPRCQVLPQQKTIKYLSFDQNCVASTQETDIGGNWICKAKSRWNPIKSQLLLYWTGAATHNRRRGRFSSPGRRLSGEPGAPPRSGWSGRCPPGWRGTWGCWWCPRCPPRSSSARWTPRWSTLNINRFYLSSLSLSQSACS